MRLEVFTDEALAARARAGDDRAFEEQARRYRRVIGAAIRRPGFGMGWEDEEQDALIGLFNACRAHRPDRSRFASLASVCIRNRVSNARAREVPRAPDRQRGTRARPCDRRCRSTLREAAAAVGASHSTVVRWLQAAA